MTFTWQPDQEPELSPIPLWRWSLIILRAIPLIVILSIGVCLTAILRLIERPLFGLHRPVTPYITTAVCRLCMLIFGIGYETEGEIMRERGAVVANHSSWLDIFALNAGKRIYFVSKSEVAGWPGIGVLARITGTVFIARDPKQAKQQLELFEKRLMAGHKLLFFPEGTSTDGVRVIPFKTTLFQSFFNHDLRDQMKIQPVTLIYTAPESRDHRFYGWWGDMDFGTHLLRVLATARQGHVKIVYHPAVKVADFPNRKALAKHVEDVVRAGMPPDRRIT